MSIWIKANEIKPPNCLSVLLSINLYWDKANIADTVTRTGFYSDELEESEEGFYLETDLEQHRLLDADLEKVTAWTLLPTFGDK